MMVVEMINLLICVFLAIFILAIVSFAVCFVGYIAEEVNDEDEGIFIKLQKQFIFIFK